MKKKWFALALAALMVLPMAACGKKEPAAETTAAPAASAGSEMGGSASETAKPDVSGGSKTIHLWATGSDNVRQVYEVLIEDFNKNAEVNKGYQVELQFLLSGTGGQSMTDMLAAAYKANQTNTDYDLIDLGGDDLSKMISLIGEQGFVKLDTAKLPNSGRVTAKSATAPEYCQPYRGTTVILAYNSKNVEKAPQTTEELYQWIKDNPGRFAYNTPGTGGAGDSFARTSVYNFIKDEAAMTSDDPKWEAEWDEGFKLLAELHPYMYKSGGSIVYPNKNQGALDLLAQGEIDMCPMWADMLLSQRAMGTVPADVKITTVKPSFTGSVQSLMIPTFGSNEDGAYTFMDYMLTDAAQEIMVKKMAAIPLVDVSNMDMTGYEDLKDLDVSSFRILSIGSLDTAFNERWDTEIGSIG